MNEAVMTYPATITVAISLLIQVVKGVPHIPRWSLPLLAICLGAGAFVWSWGLNIQSLTNGIVVGAGAVGIQQTGSHLSDAFRPKPKEPK